MYSSICQRIYTLYVLYNYYIIVTKLHRMALHCNGEQIKIVYKDHTLYLIYSKY